MLWISPLMLSYAYSAGDLLETPQTYQYSLYQGEAFVEAWRESRLAALANLPTPARLLIESATFNDSADVSRLLGHLCQNLREGQFDSEATYWLPRLLKKFEVSKRLYAGYEAAAPHRAVAGSDFRALQPYLLLSECMLHGWKASSAAYYLNGLLKLMDTLVSQQARLSPEQAAYLAWLLIQEQAVLQALAGGAHP